MKDASLAPKIWSDVEVTFSNMAIPLSAGKETFPQIRFRVGSKRSKAASNEFAFFEHSKREVVGRLPTIEKPFNVEWVSTGKKSLSEKASWQMCGKEEESAQFASYFCSIIGEKKV